MRISSIIILAVTLALSGCVTQPQLDTSAGAQRTYDGLYPIDNTIVDRAWARADLDFTGYTRIKLQNVGVNYRPVSSKNTRAGMRGSATEFPISEENRERLKTTFSEAFVAEMAKLDQFDLTQDTGADVLLVRAGLVDVISRVPEERFGRSDVYLDSVGEATLVIEVSDSSSGAVLIRVADRRNAGSGDIGLPANRASNWREVKILAEFWARLLRQQLDAVYNQMILSENAIE